MENLTNKILELKNNKKYFVIRQATYRENTYYFVVEVTSDGEDFTDNFKFLKKVKDKDGFIITEEKDKEILEVLAKNIKVSLE